ncbi:hypothetical protein RZS08_11445, partial [Arthrospira platensis SPKY1]|nr:hypothetical protein [Arthrospira platensis SPKY1]
MVELFHLLAGSVLGNYSFGCQQQENERQRNEKRTGYQHGGSNGLGGEWGQIIANRHEGQALEHLAHGFGVLGRFYG